MCAWITATGLGAPRGGAPGGRGQNRRPPPGFWARGGKARRRSPPARFWGGGGGGVLGGVYHGQGVGRGYGVRACHQREERARQRVLVASRIKGQCGELFRGREGQRGRERAGLGQGIVVDVEPRDAEVGEHDALGPPRLRGTEQDVRRFDVPVQYPVVVREVECVRDLAEDVDRSGRIEDTDLRGIGASHILHRDPRALTFYAAVEYPDDVRMVEPCREVRLSGEPRSGLLVTEHLLVQKFQRHRPWQPGMPSQIDGAHTAAPERPLDLVPGDVPVVRHSVVPHCIHRFFGAHQTCSECTIGSPQSNQVDRR